ncbi:MAG TPA: glutathione S-transferase C-terminal domain-containing protein [Solirubrobacterales bacterium]|jgi:glutathione S-transferase
MENAEPRLITLQISPYNELARWSLERCGIAYREEPQALIWHTIASRRAGGKGTTPVLVCGAEIVPESPQIVEWADRRSETAELFPSGADGEEARRLMMRLVDELGPESRRIAWTHLIDDLALADRHWGHGLPSTQRRAQPYLLRIAKPAIRRRMKLGDAPLEGVPVRVGEIFDEIAARLDGRRFLFGDALSAADIAFAAMASPAILPEHGFPVPMPTPDALSSVAPTVRALRAHPAGEFALRLYREERTPAP